MISWEEFRKLCAVEEAGDDLEKIKEENRRLVERYPFLAPKWETYDYEFTYLDDIPQGWKKAFGVEFCEELRNILIEGDYLDKYQVVQAKEKYGGLRWYDNGAPKRIWDKLTDIVSKYEKISERTCVRCGKPGKMIKTFWISPYCEDCFYEIFNKDEDYEKWTFDEEEF